MNKIPSLWEIRRRKAIVVAAVSVFGFSQASCMPQEDPSRILRTFAPAELRGYGTVSGELRQTPEGASLLQITCEDESKARLLQAKFLSDMSAFPGVSPGNLRISGRDIPVLSARDQGYLAAGQDGKTVHCVAGANKEVVGQALKALSGARFEAQTAVPMWLDRWDKHGFRFYYRPWERPTGVAARDYDFLGELDFLKKNDAGVVFWGVANDWDRAEGLSGDPIWEWAARIARKEGIPMAINPGMGNYGSQVWMLDRYPDQVARKVPGYCGSMSGHLAFTYAGTDTLSWAADEARDVRLGLEQELVKRFKDFPNLLSWTEPHQEGVQAYIGLGEYGPVADEGYRNFLKSKYANLKALNAAWGTHYNSWGDVRVPELAEFFGFGADSVSMSGNWHVRNYGEKDLPPAGWQTEELDDSQWESMPGGGHDRMLFREKKPAIYRMRFPVDGAWLEKNPKLWLYVLDLSIGSGPMRATLNGQFVGQNDKAWHNGRWGAFPVEGKVLRAGENLLALQVPYGRLAYRVFLSAHPPLRYPYLGKEKNAQWVDLSAWREDFTINRVRRGMDAIRQEDANRDIHIMSPDPYEGAMKDLCIEGGMHFHNTGYMGAFFANDLPMSMSGAGLPFSAEPGSPATNLAEFKNQLGLWFSEGIQGLDYFIHIGSVMWNPEMRRHFEEQTDLIHSIGKYHVPKEETAILLDSRQNQWLQFPWMYQRNDDVLPAGYFAWNPAWCFRDGDEYPIAAVTETDLEKNRAGKFSILVDANTQIMDKQIVDGIERFVREGGVFVTLGRTGQHSTTESDSWPIGRLSGYKVVGKDVHGPDGAVKTHRKLRLVSENGIFSGPKWEAATEGNGLSLEKVAPECRNLLLWQDGSVAAGIRPLGKGYIIQLGVKFCNDRIYSGGRDMTRLMLEQIFQWKAIKRNPAFLVNGAELPAMAAPGQDPPSNGHAAQGVMLRHYVSNNGLYDIWMLWNSLKEPRVVDLIFRDGLKPTYCLEVRGGKETPLGKKDGTVALRSVTVDGLESRAFLTPRGQSVQAPAEWFELQRNWWRGAEWKAGPPFPKFEHKSALDLGGDWAFTALDGQSDEEIAKLASRETDDTAWKRIPLSIWNASENKDAKHALVRRWVETPSDWKGSVALWMQAYRAPTFFLEEGRVYIDGKKVTQFSPEGAQGLDFGGLFKPGSRHLLALEVRSSAQLAGVRGNCWLDRMPEPVERLKLDGEWQASRFIAWPDVKRPQGVSTDRQPVQFPGAWIGGSAVRTFQMDPAHQGQTVALCIEEKGVRLAGAIVNGKWLGRKSASPMVIDITQWVHSDSPNEIELINIPGDLSAPKGQGTIEKVEIQYYSPDKTK